MWVLDSKCVLWATMTLSAKLDQSLGTPSSTQSAVKCLQITDKVPHLQDTRMALPLPPSSKQRKAVDKLWGGPRGDQNGSPAAPLNMSPREPRARHDTRDIDTASTLMQEEAAATSNHRWLHGHLEPSPESWLGQRPVICPAQRTHV